jgi:transcriptional regulator with XRE-family HTH domain
LRESRGFSLESLAKKAGIHIKTLRRILAGQEARLSTIELLAQVLKVTSDDLRADKPKRAEQNLSAFKFGLEVLGTLESMHQILDVLNTSSVIKNLLVESGIKVINLDSNLELFNRSGDLNRVFALCYGDLGLGKEIWLFVAIRPTQFDNFMFANATKTIDLNAFDPFGEILLMGEGKIPDKEVTLKLPNIFQIPANKILNIIHEAPHPPPLTSS